MPHKLDGTMIQKREEIVYTNLTHNGSIMDTSSVMYDPLLTNQQAGGRLQFDGHHYHAAFMKNKQSNRKDLNSSNDNYIERNRNSNANSG